MIGSHNIAYALHFLDNFDSHQTILNSGTTNSAYEALSLAAKIGLSEDRKGLIHK